MSKPSLTGGATSDEAWTKLLSWDALRYHGSGWWLDAAMPHSPLGFVLAAIALPVMWFAIGSGLTDDKDAYLATPDVIHQLWYLPLHLTCVRVAGRLWARGLPMSTAGLGLDARAQRNIARGALGTLANLGGLLVCAYFIYRDVSYGLTPNADGLIPFDDPDLWDFGALGRPVHYMMLGLWCVEWILFGYLLWLQVWTIAGWVRELRKADLGPALADILVGDSYRHSFTLFAKTATVCLGFALGNLGFIYLTGELFPREVVHIHGVGDFLREMSDLLATTVLFAAIIGAIRLFAQTLKARLSAAVESELGSVGVDALRELEHELEPSGDAGEDLERLRKRSAAQSDLVRAMAYQREIDTLGSKTLVAITAKASAPLATSAMKMKKLFGL
jgi:hypothetical protein